MNDKHKTKAQLIAELQTLRQRVTHLESSQITPTQDELKIQHHNQELILLNQIIAASVAGLSRQKLLKTACRELVKTFNIPQASAAWLNKTKTTATIVAEYQTNNASSLLNETILLKDAVFRQMLTSKAPLLVADAQNDPRLPSLHPHLYQHNIVSLLILPLLIEEDVVGSLNLSSPQAHRFSSSEIDLAWSVVDQVMNALVRTHLRQTRQLLMTAIEQSAESVMITDTEGTILYVNPAFERITGYPPLEAIGQKSNILKSGEQSAAYYKTLWETISSGKIWQGRLINKKKAGTLYTEDSSITPVRDINDQIKNYVAVKRDVSSKLSLEKQYYQAQKMEAVGRLAGGIAHDFNNMLTAIMGYAGLISATLPQDHSVYDDIQGIQKTAERAAILTRQLLTFARRQIVEPQILNLNDLILNLDKMLRRLIGEDIELIFLPTSDLGQVKIDPGQMEQVIVNLAVNARDAMPIGGKLTLETRTIVLKQEDIKPHPQLTAAKYILLSISDTGQGMTEEIKTHIFEPFFTTKKKGEGTGLGLATCFGIITQSEGYIEVRSEPGLGATFNIYLPYLDEYATYLFQHDITPTLFQGTEHILVVEDETLVRNLAVRALRKQGYTVLEAVNGEAALSLLQQQDHPELQLLLTDIVMPHMGGKELADQLTSAYLNLKTLFMSGYTDDAIIHTHILDPSIAFLPKPFTPELLTRRVREILDK